jgi:tetratricopeptide (TPR) repeat protein
MKQTLKVIPIAAAILLSSLIATAGDPVYQKLEEQITAEMEAVIDKTGEISEAEDLASRKLIQQGIQEHDRGDYKKAIEFYEKALKNNPLSSLAYYEMAYSYATSGDQKKALEATLRTLVLNPKAESAHVMKASILDDMGLTDDAIAAYRKIVDIKPDSFLAHLNLGITLLRKGDTDQAGSELRRANEIEPDHPSPYLHLSRLANTKGETYEEERYLKEFVRVGKNDKRLPLVEQRLKQLQTANITIGIPDKNDPVASARMVIGIVEGSKRAQWRQEKHRKTFPDAKSYAPSFEEEMDVITEVARLWKEQKEKNPSLAYPPYDLAIAAAKADCLNEYVWYLNREKLGQRAELWLQENKQKADAFVDWAVKAGYQEIVARKQEPEVSGQKPSIGIRDLPVLILKAAEQSKLHYEIGTAKLGDGSEFRKREGDRFRDLFKKSPNKCVSKQEAREALKAMSGNAISEVFVKVVRAFMPEDEEWITAVKMSSRLGSRYRELAPALAVSGSYDKKGNSISVKTVHPAWIPYFLAKALWRFEPGFRKRYGGDEDDKPSIAEEEFALAALIGGNLNARESKDGTTESDPYIGSIESIFANEAQTGFILLEILHKTYGVTLECLSSQQEEALRRYFFSFALERLKPGDAPSAGF